MASNKESAQSKGNNTTQLFTCLVVDDENATEFLFTRKLRKHRNILLTFAFTAEEALERLEENVFDIVLTDIKMPGYNGLELADFIQNKYPDMPVVVMTAFDTHKTKQDAYDHGAVQFFAKPINFSQLIECLETYHK